MNKQVMFTEGELIFIERVLYLFRNNQNPTDVLFNHNIKTALNIEEKIRNR